VKFHIQQAVRALILFSFSVLIFKLHFTGEIAKFINPKYVGLSQAASVLFLILFFIQITRIWSVKETQHSCDHHGHDCNHHHDHGDSPFSIKKLISYCIIVFPLITGFLLPAKVLDASIASKKGGMTILSNQAQTSQGEKTTSEQNTQNDSSTSNSLEEGLDSAALEDQPEISQEEFDKIIQKLNQNSHINMEDNVYNAYYEEISKDINKFKGRKISLKGFVYKEEGFQENQLVLSRFLITHCVADASIIGFLSEFEGATNVDQDTWIEATGVLDTTTYNGLELPIIKITEWKEISEPKEPYIYPISIKIL
jgi:putative membrane protein